MIRLPKKDGDLAYYRYIFACKDRRCKHLIKDETITDNKGTREGEEGMSDKY